MNFENAKETYRKNAIIQEQMAFGLILNLIGFYGKNFDNVFEIGAGTGFLTDEIRKNLNYKKIILNDLTDNYTNFEPNLYIKGDINEVLIPNDLDLILSNAVFQWIFDYEKLFLKLYSSLKKGGVLSFTTFGCENFSQIKDITGFGLNYPDLTNFIKNAGFKIVHFEQELKTIYFKDIKTLLEHIKLTGVKTEDKIWTKADFINFQKKYLEKYSDSLGFELTYHPVYYILEK